MASSKSKPISILSIQSSLSPSTSRAAGGVSGSVKGETLEISSSSTSGHSNQRHQRRSLRDVQDKLLDIVEKVYDVSSLQLEPIGEGAFGVAYKVIHEGEFTGRVLKATVDRSEGITSKFVMDKGGHENIARIYDVFRVDGISGFGEVWFIAIEYIPYSMKKLDPEGSRKFYEVYSTYVEENRATLHQAYVDMKDGETQAAKEFLRDYFANYRTHLPQYVEIINTLYAVCLWLLNTGKIFFFDVHSGNFGFMSKKMERASLRVFDLGDASIYRKLADKTLEETSIYHEASILGTVRSYTMASIRDKTQHAGYR